MIAVRSALRTLPVLAHSREWGGGSVDPVLIKCVFRAAAVASGAMRLLTDGKSTSAVLASYANPIRAAYAAPIHAAAAAAARGHASLPVYASAYTVRAAAGAARAIGSSVYAAADGGSGPSQTYAAASDAAAASAADAPPGAYNGRSDETFSQAVQEDGRALESGTEVSIVFQMPLWHRAPDWWKNPWNAASRWLSASPDDFDIWREWYHGRVQGLPRAFKDFDEAADEAFYRWIIEQEEEWWSRKPREVNADIKAKVEELRRLPPPSDIELQQEPNVVNYVVDDEGTVQLAPEPLPNGVQDDQDNQDNYGEIKRLIEEALDECDPTKTQDKSMAPATSILQESLGSKLSQLSPRLFVLRAKEVIRRFEARQSGEAMIPLSQGQVDAFAPLIDALRTLAEFDPKLSQIWSGSSDGKAALTKDQLETIVLALAHVKQMSPEAQQTAETYLAQVDSEAGPDDPELKKANDSVGNAVKAMGKAVKKGDEALKTTDRAIRVAEKGSKIWDMVKCKLPDGETITSLLEWMSKFG
ncbi:MAG: hypothetical protein AAF692_05005 [Pseudomonadota bacterium]